MARWVVVGLVVCLCAVVVSLSFASRSEGAYPGANGMIAYSSKLLSDGWSIHTINPDGTGGAMLLDGAANRVWSPDGNKVLFNRFPMLGYADIYVMNADGTGEHQLTSGFPAWSAAWSPDGTKIAYDRSGPSNIAQGELWTMNADGSDQTQITSDGFGKLGLTWGMTPSGSKIAFIRFLSGVWGFFTINPDGSGLTQLTGISDTLAHNALETGPGGFDWSPDGTKLAFSSYVDIVSGCNGVNHAPYDIYVYDASTNSVADVSNTPIWEGPHEVTPAWSPDGTKIAFAARTDTCVGGQEGHAGSHLLDECRRWRSPPTYDAAEFVPVV